MLLKADLHTHTERSPDSLTTLEQAVAAAKQAGLDFLAVTDHDVPPPGEVFSTPVRDGVTLIPGVEYSTDKGHLLGLFLERPCKSAGGKRLPFQEAAEEIHRCGGITILAHPFQSTVQTPEERFAMLREMEPFLDGIEVANRRAGKKRRNANELAAEAADRFLKPCVRTAGSDAHLPEETGTAFLTVEWAEKSARGLKEALLAGAPAAYECAPCRNRFIAESQKIKLKKTHAGPGKWARWYAFRILCAWRDAKRRKGG